MEAFSLDEAQLFRVLSRIFGKDRVIPQMRVVAVCGGVIADTVEAAVPGARAWSGKNTCLFTLVDADDEPQLVVEFFSGFSQFVDPREEEHQRYLPAILNGVGIRYVTFHIEEFRELANCGEPNEFYRAFGEKLGLGDIVGEGLSRDDG